MELGARDCWIFDLDGTLTLAVHDFDAIRAELGLPAGRPILETLSALPRDRAEPLYARLDAIERELAARARAARGAHALLQELAGRGRRLGILTRNSRANAQVTLRACGLAEFFAGECVLGREAAAPKPSPHGVQLLLRRWEAAPERAVVVGDYLFDLQAGRGAGAATVHVDPTGAFPFAEHADHQVRGLDELLGA